MPISTCTTALYQIQDIQQVSKIKILGITYKTGFKTNEVEENWKEVNEKIERQIKIWSRRDLSIQGKIIVVKTFLISNCIHILQSIGLNENILKDINRKLFTFI